MIFEIPGEPIAQKRPRLTTRGKFPHAYDSQSKERDSIHLILHQKFMNHYNSLEKKDGLNYSDFLNPSKLTDFDYYVLDLEFHLSYPKMWKQKDIRKYQWGLKVCDDTKDYDNLTKFILDCCNENLIKDDRYVIKGTSTKLYSDKPKTVIKIMAKKNIELQEKAMQILSLISPQEFNKLTEVIDELQNSLQDIDEVEDLSLQTFQLNSEYHRQQLTKAAICLSYMADNFGNVLATIAKKYPSYWSDIDREEMNKEESLRYGKPIC